MRITDTTKEDKFALSELFTEITPERMDELDEQATQIILQGARADEVVVSLYNIADQPEEYFYVGIIAAVFYANQRDLYDMLVALS